MNFTLRRSLVGWKASAYRVFLLRTPLPCAVAEALMQTHDRQATEARLVSFLCRETVE